MGYLGGMLGEGGHADAGGADASIDYGVDGGGHGVAHAGAMDGGGFHFPLFSPLALATLAGATGGFGLLALHGLHAGDVASLGIAVPAGLATTYAVTYAGWRFISGAVGSTHIRAADLVGVTAEVTTPIPAGGLGEVAAVIRGQRFTNAARAADGGAVPRGAHVKVKEMVGTTLVVERPGAKPPA